MSARPQLQVLEGGAAGPLEAPRERCEAMLAFLETKAQEALREGRWMDHSDMERKLEEGGRELMREMMQAWLNLMAQAEAQGAVVDAEGEERTRRRVHTRHLETIFGEVAVERLGYGAEGKDSLHPLDAHLNLPEELYSFEVRRRVAEEAARSSFEEARKTLARYTGADVPKRQMEELVQRAASDFDDFYEWRRQEGQAAPEPAAASLLVLSADATGVLMREEDLRPATREAARRARAERGGKGALGQAPKRHRTRMAVVASVYTVAPYVRTPDDVLRALAEGERGPSKRPKPEHKRVLASVEKEVWDVLEEAFHDALDRDVDRKLKWVCVVDGHEHQLAVIRKLAKAYGAKLTIVIDLYHVLQYVWKAGHALAGVDPDETEETNDQRDRLRVRHWVLERIGRILEGDASQVAAGMRRSATNRKLSRKRRKPVDTCADYLLKYRPHLHYNTYLAAGMPIASGVIEGACRHLVKDRLALTGARWRLQGAEAVLRLRALHHSGDFEQYWRFHKAREHERNHRASFAHGEIPPITDPAIARLSLLD